VGYRSGGAEDSRHWSVNGAYETGGGTVPPSVSVFRGVYGSVRIRGGNMASLRTICAIGAVVCALLSGGASIGGPVVHLKFNDTGSTTNVVNTGSWTTTVGMASSLCSGMTVTGRVGNCFRFTGSSGSRIRSEDGGPLFPTNAPFAIAYWVNYTSTLELATFGVGTVQTAYRTVWVEDHPSGAGKQSALCVNGALRSTSLTIRGQGWRHCVLNIYA